MIAEAEIVGGLVMRLDPQELLLGGGYPNRRPLFAVQGVHYFICLGLCGPYSVWSPTYSRPQSGRTKLRWKGGSEDWVRSDSYVDASQVWVVPNPVVARAAAQVDRTRRGARNRASLFFLLGDARSEDEVS